MFDSAKMNAFKKTSEFNCSLDRDINNYYLYSELYFEIIKYLIKTCFRDKNN